MKIYFSCSITGGRQDQPVYAALVDDLLSRGHHVLTAQLSSADIMEEEAVIAPEVVYQRDVQWVQECDALIAEVSTPSHGVGYEIALALHLEKPVLCLYQAGRPVSKMILGNNHPKLRLSAYDSLDQLLKISASFLDATFQSCK
jgi:2'-deoxynucleoside 5'-phosphate N-hydrolase